MLLGKEVIIMETINYGFDPETDQPDEKEQTSHPIVIDRLTGQPYGQESDDALSGNRDDSDAGAEAEL
jgi:hypothetical protein